MHRSFSLKEENCMYFHLQSFQYDLDRDTHITAEEVQQNLPNSQLNCVQHSLASIGCDFFEANYRYPLKPTLLKGGIQHWPAFKKWQNLPYLKIACQDQQVTTTHALILDIMKMQKHPNYWLLSKAKKLALRRKLFDRLSVPDLIEVLLQTKVGEKLPYARNISIPEPLKADIAPMPQMSSEPHGMSIFIGRRSYTDCHEHHGSDVLMCQVRGIKRVFLFPPDEDNAKALYANPLFLRNWSPVRLFEAQGISEYKNFQLSQPWIVDVHPGDALYIPNPWWHAVVSLDDEIGITVPLWYPPLRLRLSDPQTRWLLLWPPMYRTLLKENLESMPRWHEVVKAATFQEIFWTLLAAPLRLLYSK
ncbi:cupin-like domain-containing protein [Leptothoe sp. EHU-05/26/07-4]